MNALLLMLAVSTDMAQAMCLSRQIRSSGDGRVKSERSGGGTAKST